MEEGDFNERSALEWPDLDIVSRGNKLGCIILLLGKCRIQQMFVVRELDVYLNDLVRRFEDLIKLTH